MPFTPLLSAFQAQPIQRKKSAELTVLAPRTIVAISLSLCQYLADKWQAAPGYNPLPILPLTLVCRPACHCANPITPKNIIRRIR